MYEAENSEQRKTFEHKTKTISKLNKVYIEKETCRQSRSRAGALLQQQQQPNIIASVPKW